MQRQSGAKTQFENRFALLFIAAFLILSTQTLIAETSRRSYADRPSQKATDLKEKNAAVTAAQEPNRSPAVMPWPTQHPSGPNASQYDFLVQE